MTTTFKQALEQRRSYYALSPESPLNDSQLEELMQFAVKYTPSAFNSQSTRTVMLLDEAHRKLWNIVLETLRDIVPPEAFAKTEHKITSSFASGHGTVLFFEDENVIRELQEQFPTYADNFPVWADQTSAMHQLVVWTLLEESGLGASLQHYNPLIDNAVREAWHLPDHWRMIAQMPFGKPLDTPAEKEFKPLGTRVFTFDR